MVLITEMKPGWGRLSFRAGDKEPPAVAVVAKSCSSLVLGRWWAALLWVGYLLLGSQWVLRGWGKAFAHTSPSRSLWSTLGEVSSALQLAVPLPLLRRLEVENCLPGASDARPHHLSLQKAGVEDLRAQLGEDSRSRG